MSNYNSQILLFPLSSSRTINLSEVIWQHQVSARGGVIGVALPYIEGIDIAEQLFYNVSIGGLNLSKEELKREIVELVDKIDNNEILYKILVVIRTHLEILNNKGEE